ncbi:MAG TPA: NAD(P) transhydrogenase subunit alpha [Bacteroidota bacterium]|nr:NAD(P) transhydrogenase subunit alpha [Bacteroidota bacterium]
MKQLLLSGLVVCSVLLTMSTLGMNEQRQQPPGSGPAGVQVTAQQAGAAAEAPPDYWSLVFVFVLSTFIGIGVIARVSRLLHTPLMSLTNAISAIAVVGSLIVAGADYPVEIRILGAVALFASMTNIVSGFLITDRMLKMFKKEKEGASQ